MKKYELIASKDKRTFNEIVNKKLQLGWKLYGYPTVTSRHPNEGLIYFQAFIKKRS